MLLKAIVTRFKDTFCEQLCDILVKPLFEQFIPDLVKSKSEETLLHLIAEVSTLQATKLQSLFKPILYSSAVAMEVKERIAKALE